MFIFAAKDFNQSYKRLKYLQQIGAYRERQAQYIEGTEKDLHVKINELDNTKKEKSNLLVDQVKEKETLGKQRRTRHRSSLTFQTARRIKRTAKRPATQNSQDQPGNQCSDPQGDSKSRGEEPKAAAKAAAAAAAQRV